MQELANEQSQVLKQIVMTTQDFQPEADSRTVYQIADGAVKCTWAENDTVGVFPDKGGQVYFPMISGAGTKNASFDGEGWALKDGRTYGAYYPFIADILLDRNAVPVSYTGQKQVGNGSMAHLGDYDYMVAAPTAPEFGSAQFMFKHLSALVQLKITVHQPTTFTSVKLVTDTKAFAVEGTVDIMADAPSITPVNSSKEFVLNLQDVATIKENEVVTFYFMLPPADLREQTLKAVLVSDKGNVEIDLESKNFKAGTAYALSGEMESTVTGYKDGVVTVAEAGTMKQLLGDDYLNITSLKVVGPINGDDVRCLRQMLGGDIEYGVNIDKGSLTSLDLSDASIVEGGSYYYCYSSYYYTSNDMIGVSMFEKCGNLQDIVLPVGVTSIGKSAFSYCSSLASIDIPEGVTSIGNYAFLNCSSLTSIDIPEGVTSIGGWAFYYCSSLTSIDIPESVTSIGDYAFYYCSSLTSIDILEGVTSIGEGAFEDCSSLTSIAIPESVTSIGDHAFHGCSSLKSVHITDLSAWCKITFSNYSSNPLYYAEKLYLNNQELTEIVIPADIKQIKNDAFRGYKNLKKVIINDGVTSIGNGAFLNCSSLTSIDIPEGVTSIGNYTFSGCSSLTSIDIPEGVTLIGYDAFSGCSSLTSIDIPEGVTSIGNGAFSGCSSLTSIDIPEGVTSIGARAFDGCSSLTSIDIPEGVTSIGDYAFRNCSSLTSIDIPDSVTSIGYETFYYCSSLTSIAIPEGVTSIGDSAFLGCSSLKSVHITDLSAWCKIIFRNSSSNPLNQGAKLYLNNQELTELTIPADIKQIKNYALYGNKALTKVTMGEGVTSVGVKSFRECSSLTQVYCYGTTPPTINTSSANSSFNGSSDKRTLYVPKGYLSVYQSSSWANYFGTIKEMD